MNIVNLKKRRVIDELLNEDHVLLHVDSTREDVKVPDSCNNNPTLTLKISRLFYGKVELEEEGISSQLKFSGEYFDCYFPWDAVWGVTSEKGEQKIWEDYIPAALTAAKPEPLAAAVAEPVEVAPIEKVERPKSFLKRIK